MTERKRVLVRLKHSLAADVEIITVLPGTLEEFEEALARGELKELQTGLVDVALPAEAEIDLPAAVPESA